MDFIIVLKASGCHEQNSKAKLTSEGVLSVAAIYCQDFGFDISSLWIFFLRFQ